MRALFIVLAILGVSSALAQTCEPELREAASAVPADAPSGVFAAEMLSAAIHLVEPALPPLEWMHDLPLEPGEDGYDAVRFLAERHLLPDTWTARNLTAEAWEEMLTRYLDWYGLPPVSVEQPPDNLAIIHHLTVVLEEVSNAVRPLVLIAGDSEDRSEIAFLGLVWNWTVYPRLIVMRPEPGQDLSDGVRPLLDQLSNCAVELEHYIYAPEDTARRLFLTHADARMYVIGSKPALSTWPLLVPDGQEEEFFAFEAPEVSDRVAFAAAFDGEQLPLTTLMRMLPRLRTNLPPTRIPGLLSQPNIN